MNAPVSLTSNLCDADVIHLYTLTCPVILPLALPIKVIILTACATKPTFRPRHRLLQIIVLQSPYRPDNQPHLHTDKISRVEHKLPL